MKKTIVKEASAIPESMKGIVEKIVYNARRLRQCNLIIKARQQRAKSCNMAVVDAMHDLFSVTGERDVSISLVTDSIKVTVTPASRYEREAFDAEKFKKGLSGLDLPPGAREKVMALFASCRTAKTVERKPAVYIE